MYGPTACPSFRHDRRLPRRNGAVSLRHAVGSGLLAMAALVLVAGAVEATTFTVTTAEDAGAGSLRQAIEDAAANGTTTHTIDFDA